MHKRALVVIVLGVALSGAMALTEQTFARTNVFSETGEKVQTQHDLDEQRINAVLSNMQGLGERLKILAETQQQTNEALGKLLQFTYGNQQYLKMLAASAKEAGEAPKQTASPLVNATTYIDPQKAALAELTRVTKEQNETLKLLTTLIVQVTNEQKTTNNLLEAYLGNK